MGILEGGGDGFLDDCFWDVRRERQAQVLLESVQLEVALQRELLFSELGRAMAKAGMGEDKAVVWPC